MKILIITLLTILFFSFIKCQQDQLSCTVISSCTELGSISGNTCYRLTNDIDCWDVQPFTPVSSFSGILYGNKFRVRNLIVFNSYAGLFSNLAGGASIWDLEIENSVFRGAYAAPFAAVITSTGSSLDVPVNMLNCISRNNTVVSNTTSSLASGLVAYVNYPLIMRGCSTIYNMISAYTFSPSPNLILSSYAAGLVSYSDSKLSMYECSSTLNNILSVSNSSVDSVSSDSSFAGGLVGYNLAGDTLITECMSGHNYIYAYSNQSFLDNKMIAFSGGICGICYGTISNSVSSLNGVKTYLHPSILSNYTSSVGGISGFAYLVNTTYVNSVSNLNILRSDNSTGACECYFLFGTGCVSSCTTPTNIVTYTF